MRLIYIAGPFRGASAWDIEQNIRRAEESGLEVARLGAMPIVPHAMTRYWHGVAGVPESFWLRGTIEMLRRADAVLLIAEWRASRGSVAERAEAERLGIPVFESACDLADWLGRIPVPMPKPISRGIGSRVWRSRSCYLAAWSRDGRVNWHGGPEGAVSRAAAKRILASISDETTQLVADGIAGDRCEVGNECGRTGCPECQQ